MQKIRFVKSNLEYNVSFKSNANRIVCTFENESDAKNAPISEGFVEINEHNGVVQGNYEQYKYIYKKESNGVTIILTTDKNDVFVEVKPSVTFSASVGGTIDGEAVQTVDTYAELVIPTPVANENYEFVEWSPSIPTEGNIEKSISFTAYFKYVPTLEEVREEKINEFNTICNQTIEAGQDITLSDGTVMHFDYTQYSQMNMSDGANMALSTKESVPYYDSNNNCYLFKAIDMVTIYATCKGYVTYMLTLDHHLEAMIRRMENKEDIAALTFSEGSLDETTKAEFDAVMAQAQIVSDKYMENAIAVLG